MTKKAITNIAGINTRLRTSRKLTPNRVEHATRSLQYNQMVKMR